MAQTAGRSTRVRFDVFEADLRAGELYQSGVRVKLQSQPFRVLALLLEHAGEVVTREEFQQEIWGNGTIVDFEHSLGTAINKIRDALGDSAESPQFIETLAKRGYRFVAPVCSDVPAATEPLVPAQATSEPAPARPETVLLKAADSAAVIPTISARQHARTWRNKRLALVCAAGILLAGLATCSFLAGRAGMAAPVKVARLTFSGRVSPGDPQLESLPVIVTDGIRVFFPLIEGGGNILAEASIADGETHIVSLPSEIASPSLGDISPDGSKLLVRSHLAPEAEQALWIVPPHGGTARRIANILAHDACWMPDGQRILYATGNDLYIATENGTSTSKFATLNGRAFWLRWSPDGSKLRFTLLDPVNHTTALWEVSKNGGNLRPLLPGWTTPAKQCCGTWIGDGRYFVFQSGDQSSSDLWALAETGVSRLMPRKPLRITNGPLVYQAPIASRIGPQLFCLGMDTRLQLLWFEARTNRFVPYRKGISGRAEFSRDGQWVAWIEPSDGSLWRSRVDGSERLQLTAPPMQVFLVRWSPDNRQLVVMGREPGKPWKLYVIGASGGGWQLLVHEDRNIADPDWSPDGKKIVFGRLPELMARESQPKAIQILDVDSKQVSTIPGSEGLFSPRWSPDGRYIAATPLDQRKLMLFDTVQNKWLPLVSISVADPAWSHDGKWIYFHAFMETGAPIYRVSVAGGRLERVADMRNVGPSDVVDYSFSGLAPGDVPLVRARSWTADVYSINLDKL